MQKLFILIALFLSFGNNLFGQEIISGAWGLTLGDTKDKVIAVAKKKGFASNKLSDKTIYFKGVDFAQKKARITADFTRANSLASIMIEFDEEMDSQILTSYDEIVDDLKRKYGEPLEANEDCLGCIESNYNVRENLSEVLFMYDLRFNTVWVSQSQIDSNNKSLIILSINKNPNHAKFIFPYIAITYTESGLFKEASQEEQLERLDDY
jgi:hypothetical protein